jgi:hypothetical protein
MAVQWNLSPLFCEGAVVKKTINASIELWESIIYGRNTRKEQQR